MAALRQLVGVIMILSLPVLALTGFSGYLPSTWSSYVAGGQLSAQTSVSTVTTHSTSLYEWTWGSQTYTQTVIAEATKVLTSTSYLLSTSSTQSQSTTTASTVTTTTTSSTTSTSTTTLITSGMEHVQTIGGTSSYIRVNGYTEGFPFTAAYSGVLRSVGLNLYSAGCNVTVAVYSDNAGVKPKDLIIQLPSHVAIQGFHDYNVTGQSNSVVEGSKYWIGVQASSMSCQIYYNVANAARSYYSKTYGSFDSTWSSQSTEDAGVMANMRVTYVTPTLGWIAPLNWQPTLTGDMWQWTPDDVHTFLIKQWLAYSLVGAMFVGFFLVFSKRKVVGG